MTFPLIDLIVGRLIDVFGGNLMLPLIVIGIISVLLLSIKSGKILLLIIVVPMVTTMTIYGVSSNFFLGFGVDTQWIAVTGWLGLGLVMSSVFWAIIR